jgi:hypothetical protein
MTTTHQLGADGMTNSRRSRLYVIGGTAALLAGALFLIGAADLIITRVAYGTLGESISPVQNNWLIVIFKLHAGVGGVQISNLQVFNFLDLVILALVSITYLGLYAALHRTSKIWSIIALIQPFLGIVLFVATKSAGRSSVMGAGLVISAVMLRGNIFNKVIAFMGLLASALLLAGDLSAGAIPPSSLVATLFGIGYMLLITWLFFVARRLFQVRV